MTKNRRAGGKLLAWATLALVASLAAGAAQGQTQDQGPPVLKRVPPKASTPAPNSGAPTPAQTPVAPALPPAASAATQSLGAASEAAAPVNVQVNHYDLNLAFNFPLHQLTAAAKVDFTALETTASATFSLNANLNVTSVVDQNGQNLAAQRTNQGVLVTFAAPLTSGTSETLTFHYAGILANAQLSPISGIRTAYVGPEGAFLLYPGQWFPTVGYGTNRFSATVTADLPAQYGMVASGRPVATPQTDNTVRYTYTQQQPTFPGTVIVTQLHPLTLTEAGLTTNFYFSKDVPAALTQQYAQAAGRIFDFLTGHFGTPPTNTLMFIELPNDSLPSYSSPNLVLLSTASIGATLNYQLLMDEIAQQWFGMMVSPATLNDAWLQYGAARFCEAIYVQEVSGATAYENTIGDLTVGALSYPDTALANAAQLYPFSPQFQDLTYDKGAMLFHMLRWVAGDQNLFAAMRQYLATYAWKPATTEQFEAVLEKTSGLDLRAFFTEWYRSTGTPDFSNQYVVYRLGNADGEAPRTSTSTFAGASPAGTPASASTKGFSPRPHFRVTGKVHQQLDLFNMPVELRIETDGAAENKRVQLEGTDSDYDIETTARPRKIVIDPNNWILKTTPDLELRVDISRGDNLVAANDFPDALKQYQAALQVNQVSSLAHYRIAEAYFLQQNWQSAANEYRAALDGDLDPQWIAVWSHIQLGKIFDLTGQRDRAVNEYQLAVQTHDNTQNAQVVARQYLQTPFKPAAGVTP